MRFHRPILAVLALVLAGCATFRPGQGGPYAANAPLPSDTAVRIGRLPNGLTYYVRRNTEPRARAELRLVVNVGSTLEEDGQRGYAHFVEHMAFNGTRHFAQHQIVDFLESAGMRFGPDVNAYTSFDETVYLLQLPTDSARFLATGMDILEDWAVGIAFDSAEVASERGVIVEEWRLGRGAGQRLQDRHLTTLFGYSLYGRRLPIGDPDLVRAATSGALNHFYRTWYRPELMAVVAVGDFDPARVEAMIREHFGRIPPSAPDAPPRAEPRILPAPGTRFSVATDPEATASTVSIVHTAPSRARHTVGEYRSGIVDMLYSGVVNDRLNEITQRPGAAFIDVSSVSGPLVRTLDAFFLTARVPDGGAARGLAALLTEAERASRHGFTSGELEREKAELLRSWDQIHRERWKTTSAQYAGQYAGHFLYGGPILTVDTEWDLYRKLLPGVRASEVNTRARTWLRGRSRAVLVSIPERTNIPVPDSARLAQVVDSVRRARIRPYTESFTAAPLIAHLPEPGRVTAERVHSEVGVTEWTLSNGTRVLLKPTDFRENEITLAGRSPGGTSTLSDADYLNGVTASAAAQVGGVGDLSVVDLGKRLAGRSASVGTEISELSEGISGYAAPEDLETMLQLVYLYFTAPRRDSTAWEAYRERARESFRDRYASPASVFADSLRNALSQHHPRARPLTSASFDSIQLDRALRIYKDRFSDAGDFTFYMVGSFQPDSVRSLIERYLGSLPATGRNESWRDVGVRAPPGIVRGTVRRGVEPQARTQVVFNGPMEWDRRGSALLRTLSDALEIRLRERLREEMGGTYGVGVGASASRDPRPEYRFVVDFSAAPERLDELSRALFAELDSVRRNGISESELNKVREQHRRERETQLRENEFWMAQILAYDRYGWTLDAIADPPMSQGFTVADVREAARRYLDPSRFVQMSLYPEEPPPAARKK